MPASETGPQAIVGTVSPASAYAETVILRRLRFEEEGTEPQVLGSALGVALAPRWVLTTREFAYPWLAPLSLLSAYSDIRSPKNIDLLKANKRTSAGLPKERIGVLAPYAKGPFDVVTRRAKEVYAYKLNAFDYAAGNLGFLDFMGARPERSTEPTNLVVIYLDDALVLSDNPGVDSFPEIADASQASGDAIAVGRRAIDEHTDPFALYQTESAPFDVSGFSANYYRMHNRLEAQDLGGPLFLAPSRPTDRHQVLGVHVKVPASPCSNDFMRPVELGLSYHARLNGTEVETWLRADRESEGTYCSFRDENASGPLGTGCIAGVLPGDQSVSFSYNLPAGAELVVKASDYDPKRRREETVSNVALRIKEGTTSSDLGRRVVPQAALASWVRVPVADRDRALSIELSTPPFSSPAWGGIKIAYVLTATQVAPAVP